MAVAAMLFAMMPLAAQLKAEWGNIDTRYPMASTEYVKGTSVSKAVAWKGERVNLQLVVANGAKECSVEYLIDTLIGKHHKALYLFFVFKVIGQAVHSFFVG